MLIINPELNPFTSIFKAELEYKLNIGQKLRF